MQHLWILLVRHSGADSTRRLPVKNGMSISIGRQDADIMISHLSVSRKHALIKHIGDTLEIEDHSSKFGVFVNGIRMQTRHTFCPGDVCTLGVALDIIRVCRLPLLVYTKELFVSSVVEAFGLKIAPNISTATHYVVETVDSLQDAFYALKNNIVVVTRDFVRDILADSCIGSDNINFDSEGTPTDSLYISYIPNVRFVGNFLNGEEHCVPINYWSSWQKKLLEFLIIALGGKCSDDILNTKAVVLHISKECSQSSTILLSQLERRYFSPIETSQSRVSSLSTDSFLRKHATIKESNTGCSVPGSLNCKRFKKSWVTQNLPVYISFDDQPALVVNVDASRQVSAPSNSNRQPPEAGAFKSALFSRSK